MDFDLAEVLADAAAGRLNPEKLRWKPGASVCVVLASGGYPGKFEVGKQIDGLTDAERITSVDVFHAGTKREGDALDRHTLGWIDRVNRSGSAYLTPAVLDGRWMARVSIGAEQTERSHVEVLWRIIRAEVDAVANASL